MSFENCQDLPIEKMGSLVSAFASEKLPTGVAPSLRNVRYGFNSVATRYGVQQTIDTGKKNTYVNSLGMLIRSQMNPSQFPLLFSSDASLSYEQSQVVAGLPQALGTTADLVPNLFAWTPGSYLQMAATFQAMYMANGDLKQGVGSPAVTEGAHVDPLSQRPIGEFWQAATAYNIGEMVSPNPVNGHLYRCIVAGISAAAQPVFPLADAGMVLEGPSNPQLKWQEFTPAAGNQLPVPDANGASVTGFTTTKIAAVGALAANRDVYILCTYTNNQGETSQSGVVLAIQNTVVNDRVQVKWVGTPSWLAGLVAAFAVNTVKVYEADVPTGNAAPDVSTFKLAGTIAAVTNTLNVDAAAGGAAPPLINTANITVAGNLATGQRYFSIIFVNRFNNLSGFQQQAVMGANLTASGLQLFVGNIPVGPGNVQQRLLALGAALNANSGPFFYNSPSAAAFNGYSSFLVNDNATTFATFNISDDSLGAGTQVTRCLQKIKLPPQADVQYLPSLRRLAFCGEVGQPSLSRFSEPDDPETIFGDVGFKYIARDNGELTITHREFGSGFIIVFKESSAYQLTYGNTDPVSWGAPQLWDSVGPSGPRAVDVGINFVIFAHEFGAYLWQGSGTPLWISWEIDDQWKQINWDFGHLIRTVVDEKNHEVHFFVPFGKSTQNNVEFCVDFKRGWDDPIHYSAFAGKEVAVPIGRKWSINDRPAADAMYAFRRLVTGDGIVSTSQLLLASPFIADNGMVNRIAADTFNDNGKGLNSFYEFASVGGSGVLSIHGCTLSAKGKGRNQVTFTPYHVKDGDPPIPPRDVDLDVADNRYYPVKAEAGHKSRQWGHIISNNAQPDTWFEIFTTTVHVMPEYKSEVGPVARV